MLGAPALAADAKTRRVSVSSAGAEGTLQSVLPSISADGRYVAFWSKSDELVDGDTNGNGDVFVRDRATGITERVSVNSAGVEGDRLSRGQSISADGRYVAFESSTTNLVRRDTNGFPDIFVRDRTTGVTKRVSVSSIRVEGDNRSLSPSISADGRYVGFQSYASNLVGNDTNCSNDIFVRDRSTHKTKRVSVSTSGLEGNASSWFPSISADGRYVAFMSVATNLVGSDTNRSSDVFVRDRVTRKTRRVSVSSAGVEGDDDSYDVSISADGRYVAWQSISSNLVGSDANGSLDVFVRDRSTHRTKRVSRSSSGGQGNGSSYSASLSGDGRFVAFTAVADNLVGNDINIAYDIFVRDRVTHQTRRVSVSSARDEANGDSFGSSISADGRFVAFYSNATNLVASDTNDQYDVFIRGPLHLGTTMDYETSRAESSEPS